MAAKLVERDQFHSHRSEKNKEKKQIAFLYKRCVEKHSMILVGLFL